ncbi:MAG TPA: response regulator [Pilimelia sp.]|nr:response regulator [Pilimelia sp.]
MTASHVLLVEDEELNRALVRAILARTAEPAVRDVALAEAGNLAAARDALASTPVDVVLLDLNLPDGNGLTLAAELAERANGERPEVIALTASVLPQDRAAAMAAGCDGFLDKPYAAADLVKVLATHLARRRGTPDA